MTRHGDDSLVRYHNLENNISKQKSSKKKKKKGVILLLYFLSLITPPLSLRGRKKKEEEGVSSSWYISTSHLSLLHPPIPILSHPITTTTTTSRTTASPQYYLHPYHHLNRAKLHNATINKVSPPTAISSTTASFKPTHLYKSNAHPHLTQNIYTPLSCTPPALLPTT